MLTVSLLQWWYFEGWGIFCKNLFEKLANLADFFSFSTIFRTLFAPFRQIDSGTSVDLSISERFSAFIGRTISRLVGAMVRIFIAIAGLVVIILGFIFGLSIIIVWPFVPLFPIAGIVLAISGVSL